MNVKVEFFAISVAAVMTDMLFDSVMDFEVFLEITLLSKPHTATDLLALVWLVLGVAPQMGEVLAQGGDHSGAPLEVASEDLELPLRRRALDIINGVVV